jgi:hypothetical protein
MSILRKFADFLGLARVPEALKKDLTGEGLSFFAEGLPATVIFRSYKGAGAYASHRSILMFAFLALTDQRFVIQGGSYNEVDINLRYDDPRFKEINFKAAKKHLVLDYEAGAVQPGASGRVSVRLRLDDPAFVLGLFLKKGAKTAPSA